MLAREMIGCLHGQTHTTCHHRFTQQPRNSALVIISVVQKGDHICKGYTRAGVTLLTAVLVVKNYSLVTFSKSQVEENLPRSISLKKMITLHLICICLSSARKGILRIMKLCQVEHQHQLAHQCSTNIIEGLSGKMG